MEKATTIPGSEPAYVSRAQRQIDAKQGQQQEAKSVRVVERQMQPFGNLEGYEDEQWPGQCHQAQPERDAHQHHEFHDVNTGHAPQRIHPETHAGSAEKATEIMAADMLTKDASATRPEASG